MKVALIGTGAIAGKHAQAYQNLGFELVACTNRSEQKGRTFAERWGCEFIPTISELCRREVDWVDVCTYPDNHLEAVTLCAAQKRAVLLEKPIATDRNTAKRILEAGSDITLGVVSQKRFDDAMLFLKRAIVKGRLGRVLEADAYVKWFRSDEYYARPGKGSWQLEGGGALMNQAIHQADILLHLVGPASEVQAMWQLGARHKIESEDIVNAVLRYANGATGVIQAATAFWPGVSERIEVHGTKGMAVVTGDKLTTWEVEGDDQGQGEDPAPVDSGSMSGASDPMAIPLVAFERQFAEFASAVKEGRSPSTSAADGYRAVELVTGIYDACRTGARVQLVS